MAPDAPLETLPEQGCPPGNDSGVDKRLPRAHPSRQKRPAIMQPATTIIPITASHARGMFGTGMGSSELMRCKSRSRAGANELRSRAPGRPRPIRGYLARRLPIARRSAHGLRSKQRSREGNILARLFDLEMFRVSRRDLISKQPVSQPLAGGSAGCAYGSNPDRSRDRKHKREGDRRKRDGRESCSHGVVVK